MKQVNVLVQKFGGSSLATAELRQLAVEHIVDAQCRGFQPLVVVSAMGRFPDPYATDTLVGLLPSDVVDANHDLVLACGELISAGVLAQLLSTRNISARALSAAQARIVTNDAHGEATIARIELSAIKELLAQHVVPVVAGFQGVTPDGTVTTIGRGGSDLTAVALASALGNAPLEIYTDVDGVYDADPRSVPHAERFDKMCLTKLCEVTGKGARVMQHEAAALARSTGTTLRVVSLRSGIGTAVTACEESCHN